MKTLMLALVLLFSVNCQAQTLKEWVRQRRTQKEYLLTQVAANQLYFDLLKKGYRIVHSGIGVIGDLKRGEFNLYDQFFASLKTVSPSVRRYARVAETIALERDILIQCAALKRFVEQNALLSKQELSYIDRVARSVRKASEGSFLGLLDLLEKGKMDLGDHERIKRLQQVHSDISAQHGFLKRFSQDIQLLVINRWRGNNDVDELLKLNDLMY
ncbi:hypothetical protein SMI01S_07590 [Sphingobacterium mizutaii NBRC 14946 = DSM 11724]|uniref:TerB family tellurite resistance protein n=2 Tax=Sphingobacterium mizutaii TaxID=1010 RepID=A0AAJ5C005_9SPHI|nr:hypothetical protein [Sphingobacterium mizutaii]GEM67153.1 hypothetical protein SMI01S_07590 [Sphingobacterium mizutaii NBRC 14946 = DSM 11724]SDK97814.1 hypothetical protein SAMN05192578_101626 [Sphingobacterium mizutaii]SNV49279.1 Uncharacterised protein [Sphingobacterium mizutaii]